MLNKWNNKRTIQCDHWQKLGSVGYFLLQKTPTKNDDGHVLSANFSMAEIETKFGEMKHSKKAASA